MVITSLVTPKKVKILILLIPINEGITRTKKNKFQRQANVNICRQRIINYILSFGIKEQRQDAESSKISSCLLL